MRRSQPRRAAASAAFAALALSACGEGDLLTLGEQTEVPVVTSEFGNVVRVDELSVDDAGDENPTLTDDMLQIFFNSDRDGAAEGSDIWVAERASLDQPFGEPRAIGGWSDDGSDTSPAVSGDGLTLWLAWEPEKTEEDSEETTTDVRRVVREDVSADWQGPTSVEGLNTADDERPRPLGQGGRVMPLSRRVETDGGEIWQTLLAPREGDAAFGTPVLQTELAPSEVSVVDGFLSFDGLTLVFKYEAPGADGGELYWSKRTSVDEPFVGATPVPGSDVNTDDNDERDPWLSPDGNVLYFASDRDDSMKIYRAELVTPEP